MSATQEITPRQRRNSEAQEAQASKSNGQDTATINVIEINDVEVSVPVKFHTGHVLTENQAKVIQAAYERQFTNNQNALAKSRADGKNTTPQPDANMLALMFVDYEPSVGGMPRQSTMEKLRNDASWRFWVAMVTEHNGAVDAWSALPAEGRPEFKPVIVKAGAKPVQLPSGKGAVEKREAMSAALLALPQYAAGIQVQLDTILAERGTKAPAPAADTVVASGTDLI